LERNEIEREIEIFEGEDIELYEVLKKDDNIIERMELIYELNEKEKEYKKRTHEVKTPLYYECLYPINEEQVRKELKKIGREFRGYCEDCEVEMELEIGNVEMNEDEGNSDNENENYHKNEERSDRRNNKRKREFTEERMTESRTRKSQKKNKEEIIEDDNSEDNEIGKEGIELLIEELNTPVTQEMVIEENEKDDIKIKDSKKLAKRYYEIEKGTKELVKKWFDFGREFTQEINALKDKNNRKGRGNRNKSEITLKKELRTKILEHLLGYNRKTFCNRTNKAIKIYEFFMKVGSERVNRIKNTYIKTIVELNDIQMEQIREQMK
jgi:hypothetical protein